VDCGLEGLHNLAIVASEFEESLRLFLENGGNGLNRVAFYQPRVERMVDQPCPCLRSVILQGSLEEKSKLRCTRLIAHIPNRRIMGTVVGIEEFVRYEEMRRGGIGSERYECPEPA
jgi:hypothetical protein